jgi:formate dehydrogenase major subunit/NADH-quinone oxidoreductase subunit G
MITLKINNKDVSVKKGISILDAARAAGVFIPTLCHDKRLTPYGACRLCMVAERKKPAKLIPSCFTPTRDGMDIVTDNSDILKSVKMQLQLILINHPLDCPVCDKSGECTLQDLTIRYGITEAPYKLDSRYKPVDRISSLIERDMNRCILCGRCVRICGELQGRHEIDFINRGIKTVIGTDGMRSLNCDFCGQCISTCPVGALTDNIFKHTTRSWKLQKKKTVCSHCGMGCEIVLNTEKGKIRRVTAPFTEEGELQNLCARGRFGWKAYEPDINNTAPRIRTNGIDQQGDWT